MASIEVTLQLPEELVQEAREFGVLTDEFIAGLLRAEIDPRVMKMVNEEIRATRLESVQRHQRWQNTLKRSDFFDEVFGCSDEG